MSFVSQAILYAPGAFFFYPWKPLMNLFVGDSYETAYRHFRRDHSYAVNIVLHVICLWLQLFANFMLLHYVETHFLPPSHTYINDLPYVVRTGLRWLPSFCVPRLFSLTTALIWSTYLMTSARAPFVCNLAAVASIMTAFSHADDLSLETLETGCMIAFSGATVCGLFYKPKALVIAIVWLLWVFGSAQLQASEWAGCLSSEVPNAIMGQMGDNVSKALALLIIILAATPGTVPTVLVVVAAPSLRLLAILTNQPLLKLWGIAFSAMLMQGTAHALTGQQATLVNLNKSKQSKANIAKQPSKIAFEWAHVTYFPSLAYHAAYQSLTQTRSRKKTQ